MPSLPPTFRTKRQAEASEAAKKAYERERGTSRERGYTNRWDKAAASFKAKHPLCLGCHAIGRVAATEVVDHVVPHRGDMALFWDSSRWQPSCKWHHDEVKQQLEALFDQGKIKEQDLWLNSAAAQELSKILYIQ